VPFTKRLARINRVATNKVLGPLAPYAPLLGVVAHTGRRSGRHYRTPVMVWGMPTGYAIALTYGEDSDWVRNVLAAGGCSLTHRGRTVALTAPHVVHTDRHAAIPAPIAAFLRLARVTSYLELTR
jgi:deazaflavin-dependent oxidoreductase (nitroreductase family)